MSLSKGIFIVGAKRTAFGSFGGALKNHTAADLGEIVGRSALLSANVKPEDVDHVVFGNTMQTSKDAMYLPRHVGLRLGIPQNVPAVMVNRLCGSGFQAAVNAAHQILSGDSNVVLAGGSEAMSMAPFVVRNVRFGVPLFANMEFEDLLATTATDAYAKIPMGVTAENLGALYKITREEADEYSLQSQCRWRDANKAGHFKAEIEPIAIKSRKGEVNFDTDQHPRETTLEMLQKLPPVFLKNGIVTAGSSSGVCDGAAAVVVAGEKSVKSLSLKPLARIVGWSVVGCDPKIMGIGPVEAIRSLCQKTGVDLEKVDLVEVNEAFAAQVLSVKKELKLDPARLNVNGGAIAVGHPLGASGARILGHLSYELQRRNAEYAIGSACIGGGQGIAVLLKKA